MDIRIAAQLRTPGVELQTVIDDDELTAEALAADPSPPLPRDAVSLWELTDSGPRDVLPSWYMPAPMGPRAVRGWRRVLLRGTVGLIIAAFVTINAAGLCNTYGQIHL